MLIRNSCEHNGWPDQIRYTDQIHQKHVVVLQTRYMLQIRCMCCVTDQIQTDKQIQTDTNWYTQIQTDTHRNMCCGPDTCVVSYVSLKCLCCHLLINGDFWCTRNNMDCVTWCVYACDYVCVPLCLNVWVGGRVRWKWGLCVCICAHANYVCLCLHVCIAFCMGVPKYACMDGGR